jgi:hypothetical protein
MSTTKHTPAPAAKPTADLNQNEGEGSRTAGRDYDDGATNFAKSGKVDDAAAKAKSFVDQSPGEAAQAEAAGKRGPKLGKGRKS